MTFNLSASALHISHADLTSAFGDVRAQAIYIYTSIGVSIYTHCHFDIRPDKLAAGPSFPREDRVAVDQTASPVPELTGQHHTHAAYIRMYNHYHQRTIA